jgi:hypothetical protein
MNPDHLIDYGDAHRDAPIWLREQVEQLTTSSVGLSNLPDGYEDAVERGNDWVAKLRDTGVANGLTNEDVRRLEHPNEFVDLPRPVVTERYWRLRPWFEDLTLCADLPIPFTRRLLRVDVGRYTRIMLGCR